MAIDRGPVNVFSADPEDDDNWVSSHTSIQAAVDAARDGYFIIIDEGTYAEAVDLGDKGLIIRGPNAGLNDANATRWMK